MPVLVIVYLVLVLAAPLVLLVRRIAACGLMVLAPAVLCGAILQDRMRTPASVVSMPGFDDLALGYAVPLLALGIVAVVFVKSYWVFWTSWAFNLLVFCVVAYVATVVA
jgi:hypothetical protein